MNDFHDIGEKIKGKVEELKGEVNQKRGKGLKGGLQKAKGKIRQKVADVKMQARRAGAKGDVDSDKEERV